MKNRIYILFIVFTLIFILLSFRNLPIPMNIDISNMELFDRIIWSLGFLCSIKYIYDGIEMLRLVQLRNIKAKVITDFDTFRLISKNCGIKSILCGIILIFTIIFTGNKIYAAAIALLRQFLCEFAWIIGVKDGQDT